MAAVGGLCHSGCAASDGRGRSILRGRASKRQSGKTTVADASIKDEIGRQTIHNKGHDSIQKLGEAEGVRGGGRLVVIHDGMSEDGAGESELAGLLDGFPVEQAAASITNGLSMHQRKLEVSSSSDVTQGEIEFVLDALETLIAGQEIIAKIPAVEGSEGEVESLEPNILIPQFETKSTVGGGAARLEEMLEGRTLGQDESVAGESRRGRGGDGGTVAPRVGGEMRTKEVQLKGAIREFGLLNTAAEKIEGLKLHGRDAAKIGGGAADNGHEATHVRIDSTHGPGQLAHVMERVAVVAVGQREVVRKAVLVSGLHRRLGALEGVGCRRSMVMVHGGRWEAVDGGRCQQKAAVTIDTGAGGVAVAVAVGRHGIGGVGHEAGRIEGSRRVRGRRGSSGLAKATKDQMIFILVRLHNLTLLQPTRSRWLG